MPFPVVINGVVIPNFPDDLAPLLPILKRVTQSIPESNVTISASPSGSDSLGDGSPGNPVASVTKALTLVVGNRKTILLSPGDYVEAAGLVWPSVQGLLVKGLDESGQVVVSAPGATNVLTINPTFTSASFEAFLENVCISHDAQVGIEINNQNMGTRKLLVHLTGVSAEQQSTGDSIHVTHTTAGQAIRIYAKGCDEIEGLVNIVCANADDRFRFMAGCTLIGGLTVTGAVAGEVTLLQSVVLASGLTVDGTNKLNNIGCCYRTDAGVYTAFVDAFDT